MLYLDDSEVDFSSDDDDDDDEDIEDFAGGDDTMHSAGQLGKRPSGSSPAAICNPSSSCCCDRAVQHMLRHKFCINSIRHTAFH